MAIETKVQHTPGPWEAEAENIYIGPDRVYQQWGVIASNTGICTTGSRDVSEANARLIAAAPELLEALKRAVAHNESPNDYDWIGAAVLAIAKAEGRT